MEGMGSIPASTSSASLEFGEPEDSDWKPGRSSSEPRLANMACKADLVGPESTMGKQLNAHTYTRTIPTTAELVVSDNPIKTAKFSTDRLHKAISHGSSCYTCNVCPSSSGHNLANLLVRYAALHVRTSCSLPLKLTVRGAGGCVGKKNNNISLKTMQNCNQHAHEASTSRHVPEKGEFFFAFSPHFLFFSFLSDFYILPS